MICIAFSLPRLAGRGGGSSRRCGRNVRRGLLFNGHIHRWQVQYRLIVLEAQALMNGGTSGITVVLTEDFSFISSLTNLTCNRTSRRVNLVANEKKKKLSNRAIFFMRNLVVYDILAMKVGNNTFFVVVQVLDT